METRWEVKINEDTCRVDHYPWWKLEKEGDSLVLYGKMLGIRGARHGAYLYGKRHNFKVSAIVGKSSVMFGGQYASGVAPGELRIVRRESTLKL